jgi:hypothetical protein
VDERSWYGVRCVFRHRELGVYEERVTLWTAGSPDEAIGCAEAEAGEYCAALEETEYTGFAEAFRMDGAPGRGPRSSRSCGRATCLPAPMWGRSTRRGVSGPADG